MQIITIACPIALPCELLADTAPIWVDDQGNRYRVASGVLDVAPETVTTDIKKVDGTLQIVYSSSGLAALAEMGLTPETYNE